jgi:DNA replication and repair protein RecF
MLSQGQQKLLVLALLIAQFRLVSGREGAAGVLLVDDLAAELDHERWRAALERLRAVRVQLLVTALDRDLARGVVRRDGGRLFHVEHGRVGLDEG